MLRKVIRCVAIVEHNYIKRCAVQLMKKGDLQQPLIKWTMLYLKLFFTMCFITQIIKAQKLCYLSLNQIHCLEINFWGFANVLKNQIRTEDVVYLELSNTPFNTITNATFSQFINLESLLLLNNRIQLIEDYAFSNLKKLRKIVLANNFIRTLKSNYFPSSLNELIVSNNYIENLNEFNLSKLENLTLLDVSYNNINYLPKALLINQSLKIIANYNNLNCNSFQSVFTNILCFKQFENNRKKLETIPTRNILKVSKVNCKQKYDFVGCIFWIIGAIWIGIILGNIWKIKKLIFSKAKSSSDKNTQYERFDSIALIEIASGWQKCGCKLENKSVPNF